MIGMLKFDVSKDEHGVAALLELILLALVVTVVAIIGYRAWQSHHQEKPTSAVETAPKPISTPSSSGVLAIKAWGVTGPVAHPVSYTTASANTIELHSDQLATIYPHCNVPNNVGDMLRLAPGTMYGTPSKPIEQYPATVATKVGAYYYVYETGQQFCGQNDPASTSGQTLLGQINSDLESYQQKLTAS